METTDNTAVADPPDADGIREGHGAGRPHRLADRFCFLTLVGCVVASLVLTGRYLPGLLRPFLVGYPKYYAVQTLSAALLPVLTACWLLPPHRAAPGRRRAGIFPVLLLLYAAWNVLAVRWSAWPYGAVRHVMREGLFFFVALAAYRILDTGRRRRSFAAAFAVAALAAAVVQGVILLRAAAALPGRASLPAMIELFYQRAYFYGNPNFSVSILFTAVLFSLALALRATRRRGDFARPRAPAAVMWTLCALSVLAGGFLIVAADSLAGYIAVAAGGACYLLAVAPLPGKRRVAVALLVCVPAAALVLLYHPAWRGRIIGHLYGTETTLQARGIWWIAASDMMLERPLGGFGPAGYMSAYYGYEPSLGRRARFTRRVIATHPHNEFLRVGAELGLVGLLLYALLLAAPATASWRAARRSPVSERPVEFAIPCALLAFIVQAAFGLAAAAVDFALPFWLLLGATAAVARRSAAVAAHPTAAVPAGVRRTERGGRCDERFPRRAAAALAVVLVCVPAGWYWWAWGVQSYGAQRDLMHVHRVNALLRRGHRRRGRGDGDEDEDDRARLAAAWAGRIFEDVAPRLLLPHKMLHARLDTGRMLTLCGRYEEALEHLLWLQEAAPGMVDVEALLGQCYAGLGRPEKAHRYLVGHLLQRPDDTVRYAHLFALDGATATDLLRQQVIAVEGASDPGRAALLAQFCAILGRRDELDELMAVAGDAEQGASAAAIAEALEGLRGRRP